MIDETKGIRSLTADCTFLTVSGLRLSMSSTLSKIYLLHPTKLYHSNCWFRNRHPMRIVEKMELLFCLTVICAFEVTLSFFCRNESSKAMFIEIFICKSREKWFRAREGNWFFFFSFFFWGYMEAEDVGRPFTDDL